MAKHSSTFTGLETAANLNSANAKTVTVTAKWKSNCTENCSDLDLSVNESVGFSYTGAVKGVTLKKAGYYKLEVWGAQGGSGYRRSVAMIGGYGGYAYGTINKSKDDVIYIVVGGKGSNVTTALKCSGGGYNGGGCGISTYSNDDWDTGGGGGATHIATVTGLLSTLSSETNKSKVLIVAGGGGSSASGWDTDGLGGSGGGYTGANGTQTNNNGYVGQGGSQSAGGNTTGTYDGSVTSYDSGAFGRGGYRNNTNLSNNSVAGGGSGYYGGGTGSWGGAGGGSGYIGNSSLSSKGMYMYSTGCTSSTATATYTVCTSSTGAHVANRANTGDGYAKITYLGT